MKIKNLEETTRCFLTLSDISIMAQKEELMVSLEDIKKYILHRRSDELLKHWFPYLEGGLKGIYFSLYLETTSVWY